MRRPNIERAISLAVFHPWKPSAQGRISPTPTLQYSRWCSWQCIMKIGRETCYPLPWRAFKSWINFFLPSLPESLPIFQTFLAPVWAHTHTHTDVERWRHRVSLSLHDFCQLSFFPFLSTRKSEIWRGSFLSTEIFSSSGVDLIFPFFTWNDAWFLPV